MNDTACQCVPESSIAFLWNFSAVLQSSRSDWRLPDCPTVPPTSYLLSHRYWTHNVSVVDVELVDARRKQTNLANILLPSSRHSISFRCRIGHSSAAFTFCSSSWRVVDDVISQIPSVQGISRARFITWPSVVRRRLVTWLHRLQICTFFFPL